MNNNTNKDIKNLVDNLNNLNLDELNNKFQQLESVNRELNERIKLLEQQHSNEIKLKNKELFNLQSQVDFYKQQYDQLRKIELVVLDDDSDDDISENQFTTISTTSTISTQEGKLKQNLVYNKELDYYETAKESQEVIELIESDDDQNSCKEINYSVKNEPDYNVKKESNYDIKKEQEYNVKKEPNYNVKKEL